MFVVGVILPIVQNGDIQVQTLYVIVKTPALDWTLGHTFIDRCICSNSPLEKSHCRLAFNLPHVTLLHKIHLELEGKILAVILRDDEWDTTVGILVAKLPMICKEFESHMMVEAVRISFDADCKCSNRITWS